MKADIQSHISLPDKNEQVLFCRLTEEQKTMYRGYLQNSDIISEIMNGNCKVFVGISRLRSICNHPDIFLTNLVKYIIYIFIVMYLLTYIYFEFFVDFLFIGNWCLWVLEKIW